MEIFQNNYFVINVLSDILNVSKNLMVSNIFNISKYSTFQNIQYFPVIYFLLLLFFYTFFEDAI
jgi:hypothetical protein